MGPKKFMGPTKYFGSEEILGQQKILILKISWVQKNCESKNVLGSKKVAWTNVTMTVGQMNQVGLVGVCVEFQLPSMSRSS